MIKTIGDWLRQRSLQKKPAKLPPEVRNSPLLRGLGFGDKPPEPRTIHHLESDEALEITFDKDKSANGIDPEALRRRRRRWLRKR